MKLDSPELKAYISHLAKERESLVAKYLDETGFKPSQIVLVQRTDVSGVRFYPAPKEAGDVGPSETKRSRTMRAKDFEALKRLHEIAQQNAFSYKIEYSEASDQFELELWGIGEGEKFYMKKCRYISDGVHSLDQQVEAFLEGLK